MNRRAIGFWAGFAAVLLAVGLATGGSQQSGPPLHPRSTDPTGTRALMILLDERGADIVDGLPQGEVETALLLADQLDVDGRSILDDWVIAGGELVVVDPSSPFAPPDTVVAAREVLDAGACTIDGLDGLTLEASGFLRYPNGSVGGSGDGIDPDRPQRSAIDWCFGDGDASYVHVRSRGDGRIVSLGGGLPLTNDYLAEADNAILAVELLNPSPSRPATIAVLHDPIVTAGSRSLGDLVPTGAKWAALQLLVAFALYVAWRLPRFGRPVPEPQPVALPASLLVRASAELHRRAGGYREAAAILRIDLDRRLRRRLRASPDLPTTALVEAATDSGPVTSDVVDRALTGAVTADSDGLVALLQDVDAVNRALFAATLPSDTLPSDTLHEHTLHEPVLPEPADRVSETIAEHDPTIGANP